MPPTDRTPPPPLWRAIETLLHVEADAAAHSDPVAPFECVECDIGMVQSVSGPSPERTRDGRPIPDAYMLPTCDGCGETYVTEQIGAQLDQLCARAAEARAEIDAFIARLAAAERERDAAVAALRSLYDALPTCECCDEAATRTWEYSHDVDDGRAVHTCAHSFYCGAHEPRDWRSAAGAALDGPHPIAHEYALPATRAALARERDRMRDDNGNG